MDFQFNDIDVSIDKTNRFACSKKEREKTTKTLLRKVSGSFRAGCLCAIMGPSGAGKTTLLNVLSSRIMNGVNIKGDIRVNGKSVPSSFYSKFCAYVPQDSVLLGTLTPRELVMFACSLRLPADTSQQAKDVQTQTILKMLDLLDCCDRRVGDDMTRGVSGGEKRRTSIAVELVTDPSFLFLDEPTTGVDSLTSLAVMKSVKGLTKGGKSNRTVITTIHQPGYKLFELFDHLTLVCNGYMVYCGPAAQAQRHFSTAGFICPVNTNPAEFYLDVMKKMPQQSVDLLTSTNRQAFLKHMHLSEQSKEARFNMSTVSLGPSDDEKKMQCSAAIYAWCHTFFYLSKRCYYTQSRQPLLHKSRMLQTFVLGGLVGSTFYGLENDQDGIQNRLGAIYFIAICQMFGYALDVVLTFAEEREVYVRESGDCIYGAGQYFLAKTIIDLPTTALTSFIFSLIIYFCIGFAQTWVQFFRFTVILTLLAYDGQALGLLVATIVKDGRVATVLAPLSIAPFILFTSYAMEVDHIPPHLRWMQVCSPFWWSFNALTINEFRGLVLRCTEEQLVVFPSATPGLDSMCRFVYGEQVLKRHFIDPDTMGDCVKMLMVIAAGFRLISLGILKFLSRRTQPKL